MKWQLQETRALQVEFSSILPTDGYRLSLFGRGPIALHGLVHFLNTIGPSLTKVIYAYFDRISYRYIHNRIKRGIDDDKMLQCTYLYWPVARVAYHDAFPSLPREKFEPQAAQPLHGSFWLQSLIVEAKQLYTETLLHTNSAHRDAFSPRRCYTQSLWHTNIFTQKCFYSQTLLHTNTFTDRPFYTQTLLQTDPFTHRPFDAHTHTRFFTLLLLLLHVFLQAFLIVNSVVFSCFWSVSEQNTP